jgi:putative Holliday junction resolvase
MKQRIISLDVGDKRVGIASAYYNSNSVSPIGIFKRQNSVAEKAVLDLIAIGDVETLVVGLPLGSDGSENEQCLKVRSFARRIVRRAEVNSKFVKLFFVDEYASSLESYERLKAANSRRGLSEHVDAYAACIILERYLENAK